ncbi:MULTISPECIES: 3-mercaptopyruvate sulfurtransferase [unclassified Mesorhizobium]|uniref:3-mercaptopyruvate sulfurtransferase n=1 Tax=unclassified Mesorhizobium TaxID=325217 RepID=UPI001CCA71BB|nr:MULTISPECIES: 3-mercaptopyruvate sulfurtransferase [unclassified Mesorhizobium]MBZ9740488.1 3-mercaptopyruvate sulfurtransferase [Mesorhizobium sp. CO1-1-4]MBZ9800481.1 3-mercaptopyruvate sulfurtransferase [Mesorhizobium sp. ES1-6]
MAEDSPFTVDADWLQQRLSQPGLTIIDASWYLPAQKRDARAEYDAAHIPGARFLDQDAVSDSDAALPHTLASPRHFAQYVGAMGVSADDTIVVYDGPGFFSAPRAWWMFRVMGVFQTYVLDGGFDGWKAAGRPVTAEPTKIAPSVFHADFDAARVVGLADMRRIVDTGESQIADARGAGRFTGAEPEPRAGIRSGHMPGARNIPYSALSENGRLLPKDRLRKVIEDAGIDLSRPVVTSCGSGVTAAVVTLALETLGHTENRLYDGSWTEWGGLSDTPVVTGPATTGPAAAGKE